MHSKDLGRKPKMLQNDNKNQNRKIKYDHGWGKFTSLRY